MKYIISIKHIKIYNNTYIYIGYFNTCLPYTSIRKQRFRPVLDRYGLILHGNEISFKYFFFIHLSSSSFWSLSAYVFASRTHEWFVLVYIYIYILFIFFVFLTNNSIHVRLFKLSVIFNTLQTYNYQKYLYSLERWTIWILVWLFIFFRLLLIILSTKMLNSLDYLR